MPSLRDIFRQKSYADKFYDRYMHSEFVVFDTETTGLNTWTDDIVQIAAVKVRNGTTVEGSAFNVFIETERQIPPLLGHIVNPVVAAYATHPHESRGAGLRLFIDYIGNDPVIAHNSRFDYGMLTNNVRRALGIKIKLEVWDSLRLIRSVEPGHRSYSLKALIDSLHLEGVNSHLADDDTAALLSLIDYCRKKIEATRGR